MVNIWSWNTYLAPYYFVEKGNSPLNKWTKTRAVKEREIDKCGANGSEQEDVFIEEGHNEVISVTQLLASTEERQKMMFRLKTVEQRKPGTLGVSREKVHESKKSSRRLWK